jgi:hypothetical protein
MSIVIGGHEEEDAIWKEASVERERIRSLKPAQAMDEALQKLNKEPMTEAEAVFFMIDEIINFKYGGLDIFPKYEWEDFYTVKMSYADFQCSTWQAGVVKIYLWMKYYQKVKERLAQIQ